MSETIRPGGDGSQSTLQENRLPGSGTELLTPPASAGPPQPRKRKWLKRIGKFFAALICLLMAAALIGYFQIWVPNRKFSDFKWHKSADKAELRRVAHQVLRFPFGNDHDAFLILAEVGDRSSIPVLISALRWQEHTESNSGVMECTKGHCLTALRHLTRAKPGVNYEDWKRWWKEHKNDRFPGLTENLWNIRWQNATRERLVSLMRERMKEAGLPDNRGEAWAASIEKELPWEAIPSHDLSQTDLDKTLDFAGLKLFYRIDSTNHTLEIRDFVELPSKRADRDH